MDQKQSPKIIVDNRESEDFDHLLHSLGAETERKQLELGDFVCSDRVIIERKTRADFESSIMDRRLFNQLGNLISAYSRVIIIVEGEESANRVSRPALLGAYSSVVTDYGASLFFTRNLNATAELIYSIATHEQLVGKKTLSFFPKKKTFTISQTQRSIVEMFPMIGPKLAQNLLNHFGNLETLLNASEEELLKAEGMGEKRAKTFISILRSEYKREDDS
ncbi:hypothetical protein HYT84_02420 [Candidatus Micrarchaeota archaeon]|nr:hypothetical protein [Candidatus Micrarchaeota archaeon]